MKKLLTGLLCAAAMMLGASERPVLDWDFSRPNAMNFRGEACWGKYEAKGNSVTLQCGSRLSTIPLPVRKGEIIHVEMEGMADKLEGEGLDTGWCTISFLDKAKKGVGHVDLMYAIGTMPWTKVVSTPAAPGNACYFTVDLGNFGKKGGTASYRNLVISVKDTIAEDLIADSDFEDILGVNYWFLKRNGKDQNNQAYFTPNGKAELEETDRVTGKKALRLSGGASVVSQEFPYDGEDMILSGWIKRSDDFKGGMGGVQLLGLDSRGKVVAKKELNMGNAPQGWTVCQEIVSFPKQVSKVQYLIRIMPGAMGKLLVDQLRLRRIPNGAVLPYNGKENTLTVNCAKRAEKEINYRAWAGVDSLYAHWLLRPDAEQLFPYMKAAGIEMVRFREHSCGLGMYPNDNPDGTPHYDFTKWDKLMDLMVKHGFIPNITIGTTPHALAKPGTGSAGWCNPTPPKDMKKWGKYIEEIFRHSIKRYGVKEVNKWYWEIWNEPVVPAERGDYIGSKEEFVAMCEEVYLAGERVEKDTPGLHLMLGMTSGGMMGASDEFIFERLKELGKLNLIRHRSRHFYAGISSTISLTGPAIRDMQEQGKQYGCPPYESGCTEWNLTAMVSPEFNTVWCAAFAVKMVKVFLDSKLDYSTYFGLMDHPEMFGAKEIFCAGMGLFTRTSDYGAKDGKLDAIPRPVYNSFFFLNKLKGGKRLSVKMSAEPVDGIAVMMPDGAIRMVLTNYDEELARQPYTTKVTVNFTGLKGKKYRCTENLACDEDHGNSFGAWKKMGSPTYEDTKAPAVLKEKSKPAVLKPAPVKQSKNGFSATITLPSPGIRYLEFKPE